MKVDVVFIILHYGDRKLTDRAVNSLRQLNKINSSRIIIVENGSKNYSKAEIQEAYANFNNIDVVVSNKNLGFSKGNNLGYMYARNKYDADFFIIMNNDILYPDIDFINELYVAYKERPFYVAGPDVYVPQIKYHSSPLKRYRVSIEDVENEIDVNKFVINECNKQSSKYMHKKFRKEILLSDNLFHKGLIGLKRLILGDRQIEWKKTTGDYIILQGSCLIFDRRFIKEAEKAFEPETFLYAEEYILSKRCDFNKWNVEYFPTLQVYHTYQGSLKATKPNYMDYCEKMEWSAKTSIESLEIYKKYLMNEI